MTGASTVISISKGSLLQNLKEFKKLSPAVAPVLKSNAYGHGLQEIAAVLDKENLPFFAVDSLDEALLLRDDCKINTSILTMGYVPVEAIKHTPTQSIAIGIISFQMLNNYCDNIDRNIKIHLKIDTGMNRQGVSIEQIPEVIALLKESPHLELDGIFSHFADANNPDDSYTKTQIQRWNEGIEKFKHAFPNISYFHISNSAGHAYTNSISANVTRPGMGLYGFGGNGKVDSKVHLKPILELTTVISGVKQIKLNEKIGYNGSYIAKSDMKIATLAIGYDTGIDRRLSNKGVVKIGDKFANIIGKVGMNVTTVDVSNIEDVGLDTRVIAISGVESDQNSIANIARTCDTITDDIVVGLNPFIERRIVD